MAVAFLSFLHVVDLEVREPIQTGYDLVDAHVLLMLLLLWVVYLHEVPICLRPLSGYAACLFCTCSHLDECCVRLGEKFKYDEKVPNGI